MSSDNGLYILHTIDGYRVRHLQAVENVYWDDEIKRDTDDHDVWIKNAREMWAGCELFTNFHKALEYAIKVENEEYGGYTEYGICSIKIEDRSFLGDVPVEVEEEEPSYTKSVIERQRRNHEEDQAIRRAVIDKKTKTIMGLSEIEGALQGELAVKGELMHQRDSEIEDLKEELADAEERAASGSVLKVLAQADEIKELKEELASLRQVAVPAAKFILWYLESVFDGLDMYGGDAQDKLEEFGLS